MQSNQFLQSGYCCFPYDLELADWVAASLPAARLAVASAEHSQWLRSGGTWFAGVNALPNDQRGAVDNGPPLTGQAVRHVTDGLSRQDIAWDRAQVSVCYPGYPKPMASESAAALRYRRTRDAAHIDGVLRRGENNRRYLGEYHRFILGIPMVEATPDASPFVIWEGSHEIVRETFVAYFGNIPQSEWVRHDITELYHALRRRVFANCRRLTLSAKPGEAYLVHRFALHGMAPWGTRASASADGRMICYFRPEMRSPMAWLNDA